MSPGDASPCHQQPVYALAKGNPQSVLVCPSCGQIYRLNGRPEGNWRVEPC